MNKILLIGAGQLGSRHLQGLAKVSFITQIFVVEPNSSNIEIAKSRYNEIDTNIEHEISYYQSIENLPSKEFDIVIFATNADIRYQLTKQLVDNYEIKYIIFEKVAFQNERQFEEVIELLKFKNIKGWVNCPRRCIPNYHELKETIKTFENINMEAYGVEWGLACNSVHQIDFIAFLTEDPNYTIENNNLINQVFQSKREGFVEFYGSYTGKTEKGNRFKVTCKQKESIDEKPILILKLYNDSEIIIINEGLGKVEHFKKGEIEPYKKDLFKLKYQSELTNLIVESLSNNEDLDLTTIEESYLIHKPFLKLLLQHLNKLRNTEIDTLPIT